MNLPDALLPLPWVWVGNLLFALVLLLALIRAPWFHLRDPQATNIWLGACVAVLLLWTLNGGIVEGMGFHLLAVTILTLMFGWQFAVISVALILVGVALNHDCGWGTFGWNGLSMGGVPIAVTTAVLRLAERRLPPNFFVYIFVGAFLSGILSMVAVGVVSALVLNLSGVYGWRQIADSYLPIFLLLMMPEGFLAGMLMSMAVVYRPQWVSSFDDNVYLRGR